MSAWSANMPVEWKSSKKNDFCNLGGIFYRRNIWLPSCFTQALNLFCIQRRVRIAHVWTCVSASVLPDQHVCPWVCESARSHFCPGMYEHMLMPFIMDLQASHHDAVHARHCTKPQPHPILSSSKQWEQTVFILSRNRVTGTLNRLWCCCCF